MKLSHARWVALSSILGAVAVAGPSPFNPPVVGGQVPSYAFLGLLYGCAAGHVTWRYVLDPVLNPRVPAARKHRILYATLAIAVVAIPIGLLAHRLVLGR